MFKVNSKDTRTMFLLLTLNRKMFTGCQISFKKLLISKTLPFSQFKKNPVNQFPNSKEFKSVLRKFLPIAFVAY